MKAHKKKDWKIEQLEEFLRKNSPPIPASAIFQKTPDCPDNETFVQFSIGDLKRKEKRLFYKHLSHCDRCLLTLDSIFQSYAKDMIEYPKKSSLISKFTVNPTWRIALSTSLITVVCIAILVFSLTPGPTSEMQGVIFPRDIVRSSAMLVDGARILPGSKLSFEVSSKKEGFISLYLWGKGGGEFLLSPVKVAKGLKVVAPGKCRNNIAPGENCGFSFEPGEKGQFEVFLLFSKSSPSPDHILAINKKLKGEHITVSDAAKILSEKFNIEKKISFFIDSN